MPALDQWLRLAPSPNPLGAGQSYHVFLSYRSVNRIWVLNLYDVLRQRGFEVFLDQVKLTASDELIRVLEDGLEQSQAGVLVWSSAAADSDWVRREYQVLERMGGRGKFRFVPVRLDGAPLPLFAQNRVFLDFSSYPDGPNGGELLRLLHGVVGKALSPEAARFAAEQDELAKQATLEVGAAVRNRDAESLIELLNAGGLAWATSSALGCNAADGLIKLGRNSEAIAALEKLRAQFPRAVRPQQLHALALARRGADGDLRKAQGILGALYEAGERDPETLGIYGRTWMDRFNRSGDLADLEQSRDFYAEAFERAPDDSYTGINAASKSALLGTPKDIERAGAYAAQVQRLVGTDPKPGDYWKGATVAEVLLLRRKYAEAGEAYAASIAKARSETASHDSSWRQAQLLMNKLQATSEERAHVRRAFAHLPES